jgi:hypothetical protein
MHKSPPGAPGRTIFRLLVIAGLLLQIAPLALVTPAFASTVTSATFTGGTGTVSVGSMLYAKNGGALTLTVVTSSDTKCVDVTGAFTGHQALKDATSTSWTFTFTTGAGDGVQTVTVAASPDFNPQGKCTGQSKDPATTSFILDNTGPVVTGVVSPKPNAAGWHKGDVTVTWSATDAGSGVGSGPAPTTDSQTVDTAGVTKSATATDRLGNAGSGSVTVKLDKSAPTIIGSPSPDANANGWNNTDVTVSFNCTDSLSGIKSCTGSTTLTSSAANQSVTGTAVDNADNSASASANVNIDKVAPALNGAPTTAPNAAGWYNGDVTIKWTASDALSGIATAPADSTISSEGKGLTASASVGDKAGNITGATSSPAVNIDKTAPNTTATAPANWNNSNVTVSLNPSDGMSGVAATFYKLDGSDQQSGTSVTISAEGVHTLGFWSVDNAGNTEAPKSVQVKIDRTPPTINHSQVPAANAKGWNNTDVTVTFICADTDGSGVASCTGPQTVATEGQNQPVTGTAVDNAGNTATDPATVSIDTTAPTITAATDRAPNGNGWYNADVTVSFTCDDALSGMASCDASKTLSEGANQSASGTATDAAGNTASADVKGINVDKTAPSLSGAPTTAPNGNGWYKGEVIIHWTAADALSGLSGSVPADSTITGDGDNLSASASVNDLAGNTSNTTVSGIKIDRTAPSTLVTVPDPLISGWYAHGVLVTLTTGADLSGVDKTYYSVDGGAAQEYSGPFDHAVKGIHTITFWSVDKAGNVEDATAPGHSLTLKIDDVPPTITGSRTPGANGFGWNNGPVAVSFNCSDAESGVAGCSDPVTLSDAGAGQSVKGDAVDNAGNTASATVSDINIDLTAPTVTGAATSNPNAFHWYKGDVTIHWTGQDGLSGIDPATQPADSVITGEGSNLGAGPASISDQAGNVGSGSVNGIQIDRNPPTISGATVNDDGTARSANAAGWFNSAVRVRFACNDTLSGVQECASDVVLSSNGANLSASGTATDRADNGASATVTGINIDSQAPSTIADLQCTGKNGYCRGNNATVVLTAADQAGLSGVEEIHYSTDNGGSWQSASGASASVDIKLKGSGKSKVLFYAVDNAGNSETQNGVEVKYDTMAPTVTHALTPAANADGWNNDTVMVHFNAVDDTDGSGVDPSTVTANQTISAETSGTVVKGSAEDMAGNVGADEVTVKLDKTAPTISGAATSSPNANGWYNGPVTVHFTCADQGAVQSGIATCPADVVLSTDGANQSASGTVVDKADNSASATVSGISIDSVKPAITINGLKAIYTLGEAANLSCTATDAGSGMNGSCSISVTGGQPNGVGTFNFTATATDNAGNTATQTGSYRIIYRFDGFLQPINDTAHQINQGVSIFKGGSTVPTKFQLKKADGTAVQANSLPQWLTPVKGSPTIAAVDEIVYSDTATPGGTYRWTDSQYMYNWSTKGSSTGYYYRIGVMLDDGQTYYVNIGLR